RSLNPSSIKQSTNIKPCGIQIWQDGVLLSDPNQSALLIPQENNQRERIVATPVGADHDYDISSLLANDYMAVEYYSDLASTPPGFRTGTQSCGTLVLWTRVPDFNQQQVGQEQSGTPGTQPQ
ncbi:MAG TPA: hypothetical protein VF461_16870, partial [Gemmatimonadaceae bacterium]